MTAEQNMVNNQEIVCSDDSSRFLRKLTTLDSLMHTWEIWQLQCDPDSGRE